MPSPRREQAQPSPSPAATDSTPPPPCRGCSSLHGDRPSGTGQPRSGRRGRRMAARRDRRRAARLYLVRTRSATMLARRRPWLRGARTIRRPSFPAMVERATVPAGGGRPAAIPVVLAPLLVFVMIAVASSSAVIGALAGAGVLLATAYLG